MQGFVCCQLLTCMSWWQEEGADDGIRGVTDLDVLPSSSGASSVTQHTPENTVTMGSDAQARLSQQPSLDKEQKPG